MRARLGPPVLSAVTLGGLLAGCTVPGTPAADDTATVDLQLPVGHVHGFGVNPADGRVYAATHQGLYVLDEESARVVGESRADFMGFTVLGPDVFLASGHPAFDEEGPVNLGLMRSTDAGATREVVALVRDSDFHALTTAGESHVYGLDSATGAIRVSTDGGQTWQEGTAIPARDIDADPASPTTLLAITEDGLMVSRDAGASFEPAANSHPSRCPSSTTCRPVGLERLWPGWTRQGGCGG